MYMPDVHISFVLILHSEKQSFIMGHLYIDIIDTHAYKPWLASFYIICYIRVTQGADAFFSRSHDLSFSVLHFHLQRTMSSKRCKFLYNWSDTVLLILPFSLERISPLLEFILCIHSRRVALRWDWQQTNSINKWICLVNSLDYI